MALSDQADAQQDSPSSAVVTTDVSAGQLLGFARRLIDDGQPSQAEAILKQLRTSGAEEIERQFLLAQAAEKLLRPEDAIALLRGILTDHPSLTRVRLDLGRLLFETEQFTAARYHFDLALADAPPGLVQANVRRYLREIQTRRGWRASLDVRLVPDSNANAAPAADLVELFGLPFELAQDAQQQSQFGAAIGGTFGYAFKAGERTRLHARLRGDYTVFGRSQFNDASVEFAPSVDLLRSFGIVSLEPSVFSRWFGQQRFNRGGGLRVSLRSRLSDKATGLAFVGVRHIDYRLDALDGQTYQIGGRYMRALSSSTFANLGLTYTYSDTRDPFFQYQAIGLSGGIGREYGRGVTLAAQINVRPALYRDVPNAFGRRRKDVFTQLLVSVTKRDWAIYGFAPVVRYIYARNDSSITLYRYSRHRGELGFTRAF